MHLCFTYSTKWIKINISQRPSLIDDNLSYYTYLLVIALGHKKPLLADILCLHHRFSQILMVA